VTMYLERAVIEQVLKVITRRGIGTILVVNFVLAGDETDGLTRAVQATAAAVVRRDREPVRAAYTRSGCVDLLERAGFSSVTLFDAAALKERYFPHRRDLRLADSALVCVARV
jgi:hypothetical protein